MPKPSASGAKRKPSGAPRPKGSRAAKKKDAPSAGAPPASVSPAAGQAAPERSRDSSGTAPARTAGRDGAIAFHGVRLTNPDRVLWEDQGLTKRELAEYYLEVADRILPQIVDRPLALVRCPSGAEKGCFFQKHPWAGLDEHVVRETLRHEGGEDEVVVVHDVQGVIGLVQAGVLEIHPWGAALADIERPDRLIFDFDPGEGVPWPEVVAGAREVRDRLREVDIESFAKTTGGKGVHVVVPLTPQAGWAEAKAFARDLAEAVAADSPGRYLAKASKAERKGRIFIDYLRNARGATAVAAYSTRARAGAPVSTPLSWDELSEATGADRFTVASLPARLRALDTDPWADFGRLRQTLPKRPGRKGRG